MTLLDLDALAAKVRRGYRLTITIENVSADDVGAAISGSAPPLSVAASQPEGALERAVTGVSAAPARDTDDDVLLDDDTPLGLARRFAAEQPTLELTAAAWAKRLRYSARELTKARRTPGALPHRRRGKGCGKAGRALVIKARDMEQFLQTMRDVAIGLAGPPAWYSKVSDGRKAG